MISTSGNHGRGGGTSDHDHHRHHFLGQPGKAKDDTCTQTRVRHPTDRGIDPSAAPLSPSMFGGGGQVFFENVLEARSRAYTAGARPPYGGRVNVYKRVDGSHGSSTSSTKDSNSSIDKNPSSISSQSPKISNGSDTAVDESPSKLVGKRESWIQKSWRAAGGGKQTPPTPTSATISTFSDHLDQPARKSPIVVGGAGSRPITGFLDRLRPRSNSDATGAAAAAHQALISRRKREAINMISEASSTNQSRRSSGIYCDDDEGIGMGQYSPAAALPQLRESVSSGQNVVEVDADSLCEEDIFEGHSPTVRRKRSNSEASNYLIMRKTSRPNTTEVVGSLDRHDDAYKQLLTKFTCYDLMPTQGAIVAIDSQLPTRQALASLSENGIRAALLWDSKCQAPICFLTVTDLLRIMCTYFTNPPPKTPTLSHKSGSPGTEDQAMLKTASHNPISAELADIMRQPILSNLIKAGSARYGKTTKFFALTTVGSEDTLHSAAASLRLNRLHRVTVLDTETANPLYFLSAKRLLHFLYNHMTNLPLPQAVYKSVEELHLGTWLESSRIISVTYASTIMEATEKFLDSGVSSLPVLETCVHAPKHGQCEIMDMDPNCSCNPNRLMDALTKVDLMHFILVSGWTDLQEKTVADVLKARIQHMEKLITCHRKTPLSLAIDRMIQANAHRIYIVDSSGVLEGLFSVGDLLSYLLD